MPELVVFKSEELLPEAWRPLASAGPVRTFNPGLLRASDSNSAAGGGWIFAYRVVAADGLRRIGLCRLDETLRVVPGSAVPWSDRIRFINAEAHPLQVSGWFADPRLYRLQGRLFVYWNSGWHEPQNHQFLQEIDAATLQPSGPPRELVLRGPRQPLEKNWTLFEAEGAGEASRATNKAPGRLHAIYSPAPHRVLEFSLAGEGDLVFTECATYSWNNDAYAAALGTLRGGAPPLRGGDHFWSFCHSIAGVEGNYRYVTAVYRFSAFAPFAPTDAPVGEFSLGAAAAGGRQHAKLNPAIGDIVYPCGAAHHGGRWWVSYGIDDERCAIARLTETEVAAAVRPLAGAR